jgi:hypothetical protein
MLAEALRAASNNDLLKKSISTTARHLALIAMAAEDRR